MSLKHQFIKEARLEIKKYPNLDLGIFSEEKIAKLPLPVQKYFHTCGYMGTPQMTNAVIGWEDVYLKLSPEKDWTKIACYQFNAVPQPARLAYMKSKIGRIIPFEGRDKYQDGHGNMLIKLMKIFTVADAKGREMDESALVTILAEALFVPSYALQPYITWETVGELSAKATLHHNGIAVSGIFHFNESGENIGFDTDDRNYLEKGGNYKKIKWSVVVENYFEHNNVKIPGYVRAIWHLSGGKYEYYKGRITGMKYNEQEVVVSY